MHTYRNTTPKYMLQGCVLESYINHHLLGRDYPFHKYAILNKPNYIYIKHHPVCYIETLAGTISKNIKQKDYYFYELYKNKPSMNAPVFELITNEPQKQTPAWYIKPLPQLYTPTAYNPIYSPIAKITVEAMIQHAKSIYPTYSIIIEDTAYIITKDNKQVCYSDICFLLTGKTWFRFLPLKHLHSADHITTEKAYASLQTTQWYTIAEVFKQHNITLPIVDKNINIYHIGSARRVLKDLKRQKSEAWFTEHIHLFFLGFNIKSFSGVQYVIQGSP